MKHPLDSLSKRQFTFLGEVAHEYYKFPGKYFGHCPNEYPSVDGSIPRTDIAYFILMEDNQKRVMNVEDESGRISKNTLKKIAGYRDNLRYRFKCPVNSAIITSKSLEECLACLKLSETDMIIPLLRPVVREDAREILNNILDRINSNYTFTKVEAFEITNVVRMFKDNNSSVLEEICEVIPNLQVDADDSFLWEIIYCMRCVIHKYADTVEDILRLEGVIGLNNVVSARQLMDDKIFADGEAKGFAEGEAKGLNSKLTMAIGLIDRLGIDEVIEISGFSREELLTGKLSKRG